MRNVYTKIVVFKGLQKFVKKKGVCKSLCIEFLFLFLRKVCVLNCYYLIWIENLLYIKKVKREENKSHS